MNLEHFRTSKFKIFFNHGERMTPEQQTFNEFQDHNSKFSSTMGGLQKSKNLSLKFEGDIINFQRQFERGHIIKGELKV